MLDHMVVLFLVFQGASILFAIVATSIYIPPTVQKCSLFSTASPAFMVYRFFNFILDIILSPSYFVTSTFARLTGQVRMYSFILHRILPVVLC